MPQTTMTQIKPNAAGFKSNPSNSCVAQSFCKFGFAFAFRFRIVGEGTTTTLLSLLLNFREVRRLEGDALLEDATIADGTVRRERELMTCQACSCKSMCEDISKKIRIKKY